MMKQYIKRIAIGMTQCLIALLYLPIIGMMSSCHTSNAKEVVLFCGNIGVGKSSLLNSIFQKLVFESGMSMREGLTTAQQAYVYEDILYIDTPGLSDVDLKEKLAQEIERALSANNNLKIVFVATLEAGRIKTDDLETINTVCDAIQTPFAYGIILNQVSRRVKAKLQKKGFQNYFAIQEAFLHKKPSSYLIIGRDQDMEDAPNVYLPANAEDRQALLDFIAQLKSNSIPADQEHRTVMMSSCDTSGVKEVVLFCGNTGVGKSALLNSIFQEPVFASGVSIGSGLTQAKQAHIHGNRLYIDTPGLSDVAFRKQAASEIEKALQVGKNYKIVFVATLESGRISPADLETVNTICEAIQAPFEYGIIFNKVHQHVLNKFNQEKQALIAASLPMLNKKPLWHLIIEKDNHMQDRANRYLRADSESRQALLNFIAKLPPNRIPADQVTKVDDATGEEKVQQMEAALQREMQTETCAMM